MENEKLMGQHKDAYDTLSEALVREYLLCVINAFHKSGATYFVRWHYCQYTLLTFVKYKVVATNENIQ